MCTDIANALLARIPNLRRAIVCANDVMVPDCLSECEKATILDMILLLPADDWERIRHVPVPITTIRRFSWNGRDIWLFIVHLS